MIRRIKNAPSKIPSSINHFNLFYRLTINYLVHSVRFGNFEMSKTVSPITISNYKILHSELGSMETLYKSNIHMTICLNLFACYRSVPKNLIDLERFNCTFNLLTARKLLVVRNPKAKVPVHASSFFPSSEF